MGRETAKCQIAHGLNDVEIGQREFAFRLQTLDEVGCGPAQRGDKCHVTGSRKHARKHVKQIFTIGQESLAVEREDDIGAFTGSPCGTDDLHHLAGQLRRLDAGAVETQIVHQDVAHHIDLRELGPLLVGYAVIGYAGRKKNV